MKQTEERNTGCEEIKCPDCGSEEVEGDELKINMEDYCSWQPASCSNCGASWRINLILPKRPVPPSSLFGSNDGRSS